MQVSLAPPLWKNTAVLPTSAHWIGGLTPPARRRVGSALPQFFEPLARRLGGLAVGVVAEDALQKLDRLLALPVLGQGAGRLQQGDGVQLRVVVGERHHQERRRG